MFRKGIAVYINGGKKSEKSMGTNGRVNIYNIGRNIYINYRRTISIVVQRNEAAMLILDLTKASK